MFPSHHKKHDRVEKFAGISSGIKYDSGNCICNFHLGNNIYIWKQWAHQYITNANVRYDGRQRHITAHHCEMGIYRNSISDSLHILLCATLIRLFLVLGGMGWGSFVRDCCCIHCEPQILDCFVVLLSSVWMYSISYGCRQIIVFLSILVEWAT